MAESELITQPTLRVAVAKPKFSIYYALLIIALCAMLVGCGVLYKFIRDFGGFGTVKGKVAVADRQNFLLSNREHQVHRADLLQLSSVVSVSSVANS